MAVSNRLVTLDFGGTMANSNGFYGWDPIFSDTAEAFHEVAAGNQDLRFGVVTNGSPNNPLELVTRLGIDRYFSTDAGKFLVPGIGVELEFREPYESPVKRTLSELLRRSEPRTETLEHVTTRRFPGKPSPVVIQYLMQQTGVTDRKKVVHIGDEPNDERLAYNAGIAFYPIVSGQRGELTMRRILNEALELIS